MRIIYKEVVVYVDKKYIFIPTGKDKKYGGVSDIDSVSEIDITCSDEELYKEIVDAFNRCYSMRADYERRTPLEKHLNVKSYSNACKGKKLISLKWTKEDGYTIMPTEKIRKRGYVLMRDSTFFIGDKLDYEKTIKFFKQAVELSKTY